MPSLSRRTSWVAVGLLAGLTVAARSAHAQTLSAEDAVVAAIRGNPSYEAAMHDAAAASHAAVAADRDRLPRLFANAQGEYTESHSGQGDGVVLVDRQNISGATGLRYTTPIGTDLEVGVESGASWRSSPITAATTEKVTIGPNYSGRVYGTVRQPLLQGAGTDAVLAPLLQAETSRSIAERQRDQAASQVVTDVVSAYWELWYAQRAVDVQKQALDLADRQVEETRLKLEQLGNVSRVELLQYATSQASIAESLTIAERTRAQQAVELGRLMGMQPRRARGLVAGGDPPTPLPPPSEERLYAIARAQSPRLASLEEQVKLAEQRLDAADAQNLPRLDVFATMGMSGLWAPDDIPGLGLPGDRPALSALGGLELELPLGPAAVSARLAQARSELRAAEARLVAEENAVEAQVAALAIELDTTAKQLRLATQTAQLAAELAAAEKAKLELGTGTSAEVVRAQQSQRESELRRLRAAVDQVTARARLDNQLGLLLGRYARVLPPPPESD